MGNFTRAEGAEGRTGSLSTTGARLSARAAPDGEGKGLLRRVKAAEEEIHRLRKELAATEHALRAARQQAIAPAEHELELCALLSPQARVLDINQSAIEYGGLQAEDVLGSRFEELGLFAGLDETRALLEKAVSSALTGEAVHHQHLKVRAADGSTGIADITLRPIRDESGHVVLVIAGGGDVSEYKYTLDALREAEQRFQAIFNLTFSLIGLLYTNGTVVEVNDTSLIVGKLTRSEVVGNPLWLAALLGTTPECHDLVRSMVRDAANGEFARNQIEVRNVLGEAGNLDLSVKPIFDQYGKVTMLIAEARDITDLKRMEAEVRSRADELAYVGRLNTMGEMAASIAHEINQPLCAISSYAQTCISLLANDSANRDEIVNAMQQVAIQADRGGEIIRRLRAFVRKQAPKSSPHGINAVVSEAAEFIRSDLRQKNVNLTFDLIDPDPLVMADGIQIEQVLLNLIRNGLEAIEMHPNSARIITVRTLPPVDGFVEVQVIDSGPGIPDSVMRHLFEPFFTTKSHGMGMGLSISHSIIQNHEGRLWASNSPDGGACFHLTLPNASTNRDDC